VHTPSSLRGEAKGERRSSRSSIATRSIRKWFLSLPRKGNTPFIGETRMKMEELEVKVTMMKNGIRACLAFV